MLSSIVMVGVGSSRELLWCAPGPKAACASSTAQHSTAQHHQQQSTPAPSQCNGALARGCKEPSVEKFAQLHQHLPHTDPHTKTPHSFEIIGSSVQQTSAALSLKMPVIPWFSSMRGGYVDLMTRQPINEAGPNQLAPVVPGSQQSAQVTPTPRASPRSSSRGGSLDFWEKCAKDSDSLR